MVKPFCPPPSARRTRGEPVAARLRRDILLGRYPAGGRLPPERELSARLGTNRNTLREALRTLESENLVRARQGDGTLVLDWRRGGELTLLPSFLAEDTPANERFHAILTLLNLRERLLDEVLGLATSHGTPEDFDDIQAGIDALRTARPGVETVHADVELYRRVVLSSHNLVVIWVFNTFAKIFLEMGERFPMAWELDEEYLEGLSQMLRWLRERRTGRAREEMRYAFEGRGMALVAQLHPEALDTELRRARRGKRTGR
jgi:GntR family transcriptional repressor for pyruvate dehydrogenase complex